MGKAPGPKAAAIVWLVIGGVVMACFGGPVAGAVGGLFWPHIAGGHTEGAAVERIEAAMFERDHEGGDLIRRDVGSRRLASECELKMNQRQMDFDRPDREVISWLYQAIHEYEVHNRHELEGDDGSGRLGLTALPYPVLGALESCIARSLLAPLCERTVTRIRDAATIAALTKGKADDLAERRKEFDGQIERMWCAMDAAFQAPATSGRAGRK